MAGTKYSFKLWGSIASNLNLYVYSGNNTNRALVSGTTSSYPETVTFVVPKDAFNVFVRVENAKKTNSEYFLFAQPIR